MRRKTAHWSISRQQARLSCGRVWRSGRRRTALYGAIEGILEEDFLGRILPFDRAAARAYAAIAAERRAAGRPISQLDCQIASIAHAHQAAVATRNTGDYEGCGIKVIDPWLPT